MQCWVKSEVHCTCVGVCVCACMYIVSACVFEYVCVVCFVNRYVQRVCVVCVCRYVCYICTCVYV